MRPTPPQSTFRFMSAARLRRQLESERRVRLASLEEARTTCRPEPAAVDRGLSPSVNASPQSPLFPPCSHRPPSDVADSLARVCARVHVWPTHRVTRGRGSSGLVQSWAGEGLEATAYRWRMPHGRLRVLCSRAATKRTQTGFGFGIVSSLDFGFGIGSSLDFGRGCDGASACPTVCLSVWMCACGRTCVCRRRPVPVRTNMSSVVCVFELCVSCV